MLIFLITLFVLFFLFLQHTTTTIQGILKLHYYNYDVLPYIIYIKMFHQIYIGGTMNEAESWWRIMRCLKWYLTNGHWKDLSVIIVLYRQTNRKKGIIHICIYGRLKTSLMKIMLKATFWKRNIVQQIHKNELQKN